MSKEHNATSTRRSLLRGGAAAAGTVTLAGLTGVVGPLSAATVAWTPELLTHDQAALLEKLCDLLLPSTATPGALDAGVPQYIDLELSLGDPEDQLVVIGGLAWIDEYSRSSHGATFLESSTDQQHELLRRISDEHESHPAELEAGAAFFKDLKRRTLFAYFTSEKGRVEALGRPAKVEREVFAGCPHENGNSHSA